MTKTHTMGGECKTKGCKHYALDGECRFCKGRRDYAAIVALRSTVKLVRHVLAIRIKVTPRKKVAKVKPKTVVISQIKEISVERIERGMELAADHGKVISSRPRQGRKLAGKHEKGGLHGILFKTTKRNVWYPLGAKVWIVTGTRTVKV